MYAEFPARTELYSLPAGSNSAAGGQPDVAPTPVYGALGVYLQPPNGALSDVSAIYGAVDPTAAAATPPPGVYVAVGLYRSAEHTPFAISPAPAPTPAATPAPALATARAASAAATQQTVSTIAGVSSASADGDRKSPLATNDASSGGGVEDWNEEWQYLYEMHVSTPVDASERSRRLDSCIARFISVCTPIAQTIVHELSITDPTKKTIPPLSTQIGVAGGLKYLHSNIFFKFAVDTHGLYGGDEFAQKAASNELRAINALVDLEIPHFHTPLSCLIGYAGHVIIAVTKLPVSMATIGCGSCDGGKTFVDRSAPLREMTERIGRGLNLRKHRAGPLTTPTVYETYVAGDVEGHTGTDGRLYLLDVARLLPPTPPVLGAYPPNSQLFYHFRPEFCRRELSALTAVSSDSFTGWGAYDYKAQNEYALKAFVRLMEVVIPKWIGEQLNAGGGVESAGGGDTKAAPKKSKKKTTNATTVPVAASPSPAALGALTVSTSLHAAGINIRYLGEIFNRLSVVSACGDSKANRARELMDVLLGEMVCRVTKQRLFANLRQASRQQPSLAASATADVKSDSKSSGTTEGDRERYAALIHTQWNLLFAASDSAWFGADHHWRNTLPALVLSKFHAKVSESEWNRFRVSIRKADHPIVARVQNQCAFTIAPAAVQSYFSPTPKLTPLTVSDIALVVRYKSMQVPKFTSLEDSESRYLAELRLRSQTRDGDGDGKSDGKPVDSVSSAPLLKSLIDLYVLYRGGSGDGSASEKDAKSAFANAKLYADRYVALRLRAAQPSLDAAVAYADRAEMYRKFADYESSIVDYRNALAVCERLSPAVSAPPSSGESKRDLKSEAPAASGDATAALTTTAAVLTNMSLSLRELGGADRLKLALVSAERALAIHESTSGSESVVVASACANLALIVNSITKLATAAPASAAASKSPDRAAELCARAVRILESHPTPHALIELPSALNNWGEILYQRSQYDEAIKCFERSLVIERKQLGEDHPSLCGTINNLAVLHKTVGRLASAMELYERALRIGELRLGPTHPEVGYMLNNIALLQGKIEGASAGGDNSALSRFERARSIFTAAKMPQLVASIDTNIKSLRAAMKQAKTATTTTATAAAAMKCDECGKRLTPTTVSRCGRCKRTSYCGSDCQRKHWKAHKPACKPQP